MHPQPIAYRPDPRTARRDGDLAASIVALVACGLVGMVLGGFSLMSLAFVDGCTAPDCDPAVFTRTIYLTLVTAVRLGAGGAVLTSVRLHRRRTSWPFAVATFVLVLATFVVGIAIWFQS